MPLKDRDQRRAYARKYHSDRRARDPEFKAAAYAHRDRWRAQAADERAQILAEFRAAGCKHCPESTACCLDAHHRDPAEKDFSAGDANKRCMSPERFRAELAKCDCVCKNCHAKIHAGLIA